MPIEKNCFVHDFIKRTYKEFENSTKKSVFKKSKFQFNLSCERLCDAYDMLKELKENKNKKFNFSDFQTNNNYILHFLYLTQSEYDKNTQNIFLFPSNINGEDPISSFNRGLSTDALNYVLNHPNDASINTAIVKNIPLAKEHFDLIINTCPSIISFLSHEIENKIIQCQERKENSEFKLFCVESPIIEHNLQHLLDDNYLEQLKFKPFLYVSHKQAPLLINKYSNNENAMTCIANNLFIDTADRVVAVNNGVDYTSLINAPSRVVAEYIKSIVETINADLGKAQIETNYLDMISFLLKHNDFLLEDINDISDTLMNTFFKIEDIMPHVISRQTYGTIISALVNRMFKVNCELIKDFIVNTNDIYSVEFINKAGLKAKDELLGYYGNIIKGNIPEYRREDFYKKLSSENDFIFFSYLLSKTEDIKFSSLSVDDIFSQKEKILKNSIICYDCRISRSLDELLDKNIGTEFAKKIIARNLLKAFFKNNGFSFQKTDFPHIIKFFNDGIEGVKSDNKKVYETSRNHKNYNDSFILSCNFSVPVFLSNEEIKDFKNIATKFTKEISNNKNFFAENGIRYIDSLCEMHKIDKEEFVNLLKNTMKDLFENLKENKKFKEKVNNTGIFSFINIPKNPYCLSPALTDGGKYSFVDRNINKEPNVLIEFNPYIKIRNGSILDEGNKDIEKTIRAILNDFDNQTIENLKELCMISLNKNMFNLNSFETLKHALLSIENFAYLDNQFNKILEKQKEKDCSKGVQETNVR